MGYISVFLLGDPAYYQRFGFQAAINFGIKHKLDISDKNVMAVNLGGYMLKQVNQYGKTFIMILVPLFIISFYFYTTRPVDLYSLIPKRPIESIYILTTLSSPQGTGRIPGEVEFSNKQQINQVMDILNKYKYTKIFKLYLSNTVPANPSNGAIHIIIRYSGDESPRKEQYIFVDSENDVVIRNQQGNNTEYKIAKSDQKIFYELLSFLRQIDTER